MSNSKLSTREQFRKSCFERDGYKCIICSEKATFDKNKEVDNLDCHHIIEKRLFGISGGYIESNGATVCESCHIKCEQTLISCEELREKCGIKETILPEHLYNDNT